MLFKSTIGRYFISKRLDQLLSSVYGKSAANTLAITQVNSLVNSVKEDYAAFVPGDSSLAQRIDDGFTKKLGEFNILFVL